MGVSKAMSCAIFLASLLLLANGENSVYHHNYGDALSKSLLFFEGQRSGKLPPSQRLNWRKDSALKDGSDIRRDLVGGYYDAGDNLKFHFPMAFTITLLSWSVLEFGKEMGPELPHALEAIRWGTDYLLKATSVPDVVVAQVGEPYADHNCWERPEDMDTPRNTYVVDKKHPGSEVSAEIAAALASSSIVFKIKDRRYSKLLLHRAIQVFIFADTYQGSYNNSIGKAVCPFYCDFNGYVDELIWGAAWLFEATHMPTFSNYVTKNMLNIPPLTEFGWDAKHAGIGVLYSKYMMKGRGIKQGNKFSLIADNLVCSLLPKSPYHSVKYTKGGLFVKPSGPNLQHTTTLSLLQIVYAKYLKANNNVIHCGNIVVTPNDIIEFTKTQVDYILGSNPIRMSYMVGYGKKFPKRIHHRGSSLPSKQQHPRRFTCKEGGSYLKSSKPNPNLLFGAITGGPDINDQFADNRGDFGHSEPTTYNVAPLVGVLAYFKENSNHSTHRVLDLIHNLG